MMTMTSELLVEWIIQIVSALVGSFGFSMLFDLKGKKLLLASIGGGISWVLYLLMYFFTQNMFVSTLVSSLLSTTYSEILAKHQKAPSTVFIFPAIVPLVPGRGLYYTMRYAILSDFDQCLQYGSDTLLTAVAIAFGIVIVLVLAKILRYFRKKRLALKK